MTRRPVARGALLLWAAATLVVAVPDVRADVLHLRGGGAIRTTEWWIEGDLLHYRSAAGTVGIPRAEVLHVEPSVEPEPERRPTSTVATSPVDASAGDDREMLSHLTAGSESLRTRRYEDAAVRFRRAIDLRPDDPRARIGYALAEMALGRDSLALVVVLDGLVRTPEVAELHELQGDLMSREERLEDALRSWREAFRLAPSDRVREKILKGERESAVARDLGFTSTPHFNVRYDGRLDDDLADEIMDWLEDRYGALSREFRHSPSQSITVLLYPERAFRDVTRAPDAVAGLYDGKIRVPLGGLRRLDDRARGLLVHELTHAFVHSWTRGNCPRWLHEGLAQRSEGRIPSERDLLDIRDRIERNGAEHWDAEGLSYPAALSLTLYLERRLGTSRLFRLLDDLGEGRTFDDALREASGSGYAGLCRDWARSLSAEDGDR